MLMKPCTIGNGWIDNSQIYGTFNKSQEMLFQLFHSGHFAVKEESILGQIYVLAMTLFSCKNSFQVSESKVLSVAPVLEKRSQETFAILDICRKARTHMMVTKISHKPGI